jgi:hypothetical protein
LRWANKYGGICRFSLAFQHIVLVSDPEVASKVLSRGPDSVPKKSIGYAFFDMVGCCFLGGGLWCCSAAAVQTSCVCAATSSCNLVLQEHSRLWCLPACSLATAAWPGLLALWPPAFAVM